MFLINLYVVVIQSITISETSVINYTNSSNEKLPFEIEKQKDMSFLFLDNNFDSFAKLYFLNDEMSETFKSNDLDKSEKILYERMRLISKAEKFFVGSRKF